MMQKQIPKNMQTILVQGESDADVNLIIALARKLNLEIKVLSEKEREENPETVETEKWDNLTVNQKEGILKAVKQIEEGQSISNDEILKKYRKQYHG